MKRLLLLLAVLFLLAVENVVVIILARNVGKREAETAAKVRIEILEHEVKKSSQPRRNSFIETLEQKRDTRLRRDAMQAQQEMVDEMRRANEIQERALLLK